MMNKKVRIEPIKPFQKEVGQKTKTVWFEEHNIEECIKATYQQKIQHIHLQTYTLDFLSDKRLDHILGITIQFDIKDFKPLFRHTQLTHLALTCKVDVEFDFSLFPNLIELSGELPKKHKNLYTLKLLKYIHLSKHRGPDLKEFYKFSHLRTLGLFNSNFISLEGLGKLKKLESLRIENCRKLESAKGLSRGNQKLEKIVFMKCKALHTLDYLSKLPKLSYLQLYDIPQLHSLDFLETLKSLEILHALPSKVKVQNKNYYPLVNKLKELNLLDQLKDWKPLKDYLNNSLVFENTNTDKSTELQAILQAGYIKNWAKKLEYGLDQYTVKNCEKGEAILIKLISKLEEKPDLSLPQKVKLIQRSVLAFNKLNWSISGFIETGEREELCDIFDNIADAVGIDIHQYDDGIASEWRDW